MLLEPTNRIRCPRVMVAAAACVALLAGCAESPPDARPDATSASGAAVKRVVRRPTSATPASNVDAPAPARAAPSQQPRLKVDSTVYSFGSMSLHEVRSHEFTLRNEGDAPLVVSNAAANCKCVSHKLSTHTLQPGGQATLELTWRGGEVPRERLTARINLETNDPERPVVQFSAVGAVGADIDLAPAQLHAFEITPGAPLTLSTLVTSQVWEGIQLSEITSPSESLRVSTTPLGAEERHALGCKCGWRLEVKADQGLTAADYGGHLELSAQPQNGDNAVEPRRLRIPIGWELRKSIALSGPGVDEEGVIHLGRIDRGAEVKCYLVKVTDQAPELVITDQQVSPGFLGARLEPYRKSATGWLYRMELSIPEHARAADYAKEGLVRFTFDHPRIKELRVDLDLGVGI